MMRKYDDLSDEEKKFVADMNVQVNSTAWCGAPPTVTLAYQFRPDVDSLGTVHRVVFALQRQTGEDKGRYVFDHMAPL